MSTSQWLLARMAKSESRIYGENMPTEKRLALLDRVSTQRARLERSFTSAMRELKQLQKERQAQRPQHAPVHQSAEPRVPHPSYLMSEGSQDPAVFCSPVTPDSR